MTQGDRPKGRAKLRPEGFPRALAFTRLPWGAIDHPRLLGFQVDSAMDVEALAPARLSWAADGTRGMGRMHGVDEQHGLV